MAGSIILNIPSSTITGVPVVTSDTDIIEITADDGFIFNEGVLIETDDGYGGGSKATLMYDGYLTTYDDFEPYIINPFNEDKTVISMKLEDFKYIAIGRWGSPAESYTFTGSTVEGGGSEPVFDNANFVQIIKPSDAEIRKLIYSRYDDIYKPTLSETGVTYPPLSIGDFIYKAYNIDIPIPDDVTNNKVYFGLIDTGYNMDMLNFTVLKIDLGIITIPDLKTINNIINDIEIRLFLPYVKNFTPLDRKYNNQDIEIKLHVNLLEGKGVYNLLVNDLIVESIDVEIGNNIPISFKQDLQLDVETKYKERQISVPYIQLFTKKVEPIKLNNFTDLIKHNDNINLVGEINSQDKDRIKSLINQGIIIK